jgi:helicase MOV-10
LAENRPSVLKGDHLYVRKCGNDLKEYQGFVHEVQQKEVALGFHDRYESIAT